MFIIREIISGQVHPPVLLILYTYSWLQRKHIETGAPSGAVNPVYIFIIREIHL